MGFVLITRPQPAARELAEQLEQHGLLPLVLPMYSFVARDPGDLGGLHRSGPHRKLAVFTSPRAVQFGIQHLPEANIAGLQLAVVGSSTREVLEDCGFTVHLQADSGYTSEDLLQLESLDVDPGEAFIFCAPGGRETLADGLAEKGWTVQKVFVYERADLPLDNKLVVTITAADDLLSVWTSNSAVDIAKAQMPAAAWRKILSSPLLVISARMKRHLEAMGASRVKLADGPSNAELLRSILHLHQRETGN